MKIHLRCDRIWSLEGGNYPPIENRIDSPLFVLDASRPHSTVRYVPGEKRRPEPCSSRRGREKEEETKERKGEFTGERGRNVVKPASSKRAHASAKTRLDSRFEACKYKEQRSVSSPACNYSPRLVTPFLGVSFLLSVSEPPIFLNICEWNVLSIESQAFTNFFFFILFF